MSRSWSQTLVTGAMLALAFLAGQLLPRGTDQVAAQGRSPVNPPPPTPRPEPEPGPTGTAPVVYTQDNGQAVGANGFLAVTGSYGVGTSVLYVLDTENRQLAAYEARGGSAEQRRLVFVGARRIDLDLQLEGYNDRSEYDYRELKRLFEKRGNQADVGTGLTPSSDRK